MGIFHIYGALGLEFWVEREGFVCVLNLRTTTLYRYAAVPRRARIEGSYTFVSLNSRLRLIKKKKKRAADPGRVGPRAVVARLHLRRARI